MTDLDILLFGCAVSFIAAAGAYVFLRERYMASERQEERRRAVVRVVRPKGRRAA